MKVTSYTSGNIHVFIKTESTPEESVPADILKNLGQLTEFKRLEIEENEKHPRIGMDARKVYSEVQKNGYYIHRVVLEVRES